MRLALTHLVERSWVEICRLLRLREPLVRMQLLYELSRSLIVMMRLVRRLILPMPCWPAALSCR
jgi:hypothetical protein